MKRILFFVPLFIVGCNYGQSSDCSGYVGDFAIQCQAYHQTKAETEVRQETANILKAYRICLQKHEDDPSKAKEHCAVYTQALHEIGLRMQPSREAAGGQGDDALDTHPARKAVKSEDK